MMVISITHNYSIPVYSKNAKYLCERLFPKPGTGIRPDIRQTCPISCRLGTRLNKDRIIRCIPSPKCTH